MSQSILVASDLHLSNHIWGQRPIFGDSYFALEQIVRIAEAERPQLLVLAGDILNVQTNPSTPILRLSNALHRLQAAEIPVAYVQGQHDYQEESWLSGYGNTTHAAGAVHRISDTLVAGHDFADRETLLNYFASPFFFPANGQRIDLLILHQVWKDFMGDIVAHQVSSEDIPHSVKLVITGDYHVSALKSRTLPDGYVQQILSPGSTHLRSINEPVDKFMYRLNPQGDTYQVEPIPLASRRVVRVKLANFDTLDGIFQEIDSGLAAAESYAETHGLPLELKTPLLVVEHTDDTLQASRSVKAAYGGKAHIFYVDRSSRVVAKTGFCDEDRAAGVRQGLRESLPAVLPPDTEAAAFGLASQLLSSEDKKMTLENWFVQQLNAEVTDAN